MPSISLQQGCSNDVTAFSCAELNACSVDAMGDVLTVNNQDCDILKWDANLGQWVNAQLPFQTCDDVRSCITGISPIQFDDDTGSISIINGGQSGDILVWDGGSWVVQSICSAAANCSLTGGSDCECAVLAFAGNWYYQTGGGGGSTTKYYDNDGCTDQTTNIDTNLLNTVPTDIDSLLPTTSACGATGETFVQYHLYGTSMLSGIELFTDSDFSASTGVPAAPSSNGGQLSPSWITAHHFEAGQLWDDTTDFNGDGFADGVYHMGVGTPNDDHSWSGAWFTGDASALAGINNPYFIANMPATGNGNLTLGQNVNFTQTGVYTMTFTFANPMQASHGAASIDACYDIYIGGTPTNGPAGTLLGTTGTVDNDEQVHVFTVDILIDTIGTQLIGIYQACTGSFGNDIIIGEMSLQKNEYKIIAEYTATAGCVKANWYQEINPDGTWVPNTEIYHDVNGNIIDPNTVTACTEADYINGL